jgi:hypothetical protein
MYFVPGDYSLGYMTTIANPGTGIINFFGILNIYTASIYITVENLFDKNYFIVPYYPMNDRSFKLAVSWMFND